MGDFMGTNAGAYEITVSLKDPINDTWADGTTGDKTIVWHIEKLKVVSPQVSGTVQVYSGTEKGPEITGVNPTFAAVEGATGTQAGLYETVITLKDPTNTEWAEGGVAPQKTPWGIYVCRIGEDYFTSVTRAFREERSTGELPITMLCNWAEEAVNESGEDCLYLDGYTLTSERATVTNKGTLTVKGPGTLQAVGARTEHLTPLRNEGNLTVESGVFRSIQLGNATGGAEVYGIENNGGTAVISGGTFVLDGADLAAEAICANAGEVVVNGGEFTVQNRSSGHGSYGIWAEGGTVTMNAGTFTVENRVGNANAFCGYSGTIRVNGGSTEVKAENGIATALAYGRQHLRIEIGGGTHRITGIGELIFAATNDQSSVLISGGEGILTETASDPYRVHGLLVSGGKIEMTGGHITVESHSTGDLLGSAINAGTLALIGGVLEVSSPGNGALTGVYVDKGDVRIDGVQILCTSAENTVTGIRVHALPSTVSVGSGSLSLTGRCTTPGGGTGATDPIVFTGVSTDFPVTMHYTEGYDGGAFWSAPVTFEAISAPNS